MGAEALGRRPRVRVGIVSWNTERLLARCLDALPGATAGLDADVVVVDNASSDGSAGVAEARKVTVVRNPRNAGYARAMNSALATGPATQPYDALIALNPDTVPPPGGLTHLVGTLLEHPRAGLVVPRLVYDDGTPQHSVYRFPSVRLAAVVGLVPLRWQRGWVGDRWWLEAGADHHRRGPIDWAVGAVHVMRPAAVGPGGPYSERWFIYVEDLDLCWRLARSGWDRLLEPAVAVVHTGNASGAQAFGADRARVVDAASSDWYQLRHGRVPASAWAAANWVGRRAKRLGFLAADRRAR